MTLKNLDGVDSKEFGLAAGVILTKYFLKTDHLHFGYWPPDLPVEVTNMGRAQEAYCEILVSHIPDQVSSVLDVGCGTGALSRRMLDEGFEVESVSPSPFLTSLARENLGERGVIHQSTFEELSLDRKFDLVLFSESFQYIDPGTALDKCRGLLTEKGHVLIFDFFKREDAPREIRLGGGHSMGEFYKKLEENGFSVVFDKDLTSHIAPSMDVVGGFVSEFAKPLWELMLYGLASNYPRLNRFARWKYRKKIAKIESQLLNAPYNAQSFEAVKSYRLVLVRP